MKLIKVIFLAGTVWLLMRLGVALLAYDHQPFMGMTGGLTCFLGLIVFYITVYTIKNKQI